MTNTSASAGDAFASAGGASASGGGVFGRDRGGSAGSTLRTRHSASHAVRSRAAAACSAPPWPAGASVDAVVSTSIVASI